MTEADEDVADAMQETALTCWEKIHTLRRDEFFQACAAAAVLAFTGVCAANPALAAKIPLIGKIFTEVQNTEVLFSGNYEDKATDLTIENENADAIYSTEDSGVTVTASEVYCDGMSVFLTAQVEVEQGGLDKMPGMGKQILYWDGNWSLNGQTGGNALMRKYMEGKAVDDQTFIGMLKLDLDEPAVNNGVADIDFFMIGYDDIDYLQNEDIDISHKIEGEWKLSFPIAVDTESAKTIPVNQGNNGFQLEKVFISPYQVITYTDVPYTENEVTREEYEEAMGEKVGGSDDFGITYEEYAEIFGKNYRDCLTLVFDQDGQLLIPTGEYRGYSMHAVQGKEITELYIYVFDDLDASWDAQEQGMNSEAAEKAVIKAKVNVK